MEQRFPIELAQAGNIGENEPIMKMLK